MKIINTTLTKNPCYKAGVKITVKGLMLHSVGCAQPSASVFTKKWNNESYTRACVHAFIDANTGDVHQCLPWNHRGWHSGGSANNTHIGVEMCEPSAIKYIGTSANFTVTDAAKAYMQATTAYLSAVDLFAFLCDTYRLDPLADGVIISHKEGGKRGVASGHVDPEHLWDGLGLDYTMDKFRHDVAEKMGMSLSVTDPFATAETPNGIVMKTLSRGSSGKQVKALQALLNGIARENLSVDGGFGYLTESAVKNYQAANRLTVDGVVGNKTWSALLAE